MLAHAIEVLDHNKAINLILNKTRGMARGGYYGDYGYYAGDART